MCEERLLNSVTVRTLDELLQSLKSPNVAIIAVEAFLSEVPGFRLSPNQEIRGTSSELAGLKFHSGQRRHTVVFKQFSINFETHHGS